MTVARRLRLRREAASRPLGGGDSRRACFVCWRAAARQAAAARGLQRREQQLEALSAGLPAWVRHLGDRRRLERAWLSWRLALVAGGAARAVRRLQSRRSTAASATPRRSDEDRQFEQRGQQRQPLPPPKQQQREPEPIPAPAAPAAPPAGQLEHAEPMAQVDQPIPPPPPPLQQPAQQLQPAQQQRACGPELGQQLPQELELEPTAPSMPPAAAAPPAASAEPSAASDPFRLRPLRRSTRPAAVAPAPAPAPMLATAARAVRRATSPAVLSGAVAAKTPGSSRRQSRTAPPALAAARPLNAALRQHAPAAAQIVPAGGGGGGAVPVAQPAAGPGPGLAQQQQGAVDVVCARYVDARGRLEGARAELVQQTRALFVRGADAASPTQAAAMAVATEEEQEEEEMAQASGAPPAVPMIRLLPPPLLSQLPGQVVAGFMAAARDGLAASARPWLRRSPAEAAADAGAARVIDALGVPWPGGAPAAPMPPAPASPLPQGEMADAAGSNAEVAASPVLSRPPTAVVDARPVSAAPPPSRSLAVSPEPWASGSAAWPLSPPSAAAAARQQLNASEALLASSADDVWRVLGQPRRTLVASPAPAGAVDGGGRGSPVRAQQRGPSPCRASPPPPSPGGVVRFPRLA